MGSHMTAPRAALMTITPAIASDWLNRNTRNRPLKKTLVQRIAREISEGRWQMNGDTIRLSDDGTLLDGQHRLHAIVAAGKSVESLVAFNIPSDSFLTIDTTRAVRNGGDLLALEGKKNAIATAATAKLAYAWKRTGNPFNSNANVSPSAGQIRDFVEAHPSICDATSWIHGQGASLTNLMQCSRMCFAMWRFQERDEDKAKEFFRQLRDGAGLDENSPVLALRNRLIQEKIGKTRMLPEYQLALMFKAWRLFREGKQTKALRIVESRQSSADIWDA